MYHNKTTFSWHYWWTYLSYYILTHIKFFKTSHKNKKHNLKYDKWTAKEAESITYDILLVYLIGPYKIWREDNDEPLVLKFLTMVEPVTSWF